MQIGRRVEATTRHSGFTWSGNRLFAVCLLFCPLFYLYKRLFLPLDGICVLYREPIFDTFPVIFCQLEEIGFAPTMTERDMTPRPGALPCTHISEQVDG